MTGSITSPQCTQRLTRKSACASPAMESKDSSTTISPVHLKHRVEPAGFSCRFRIFSYAIAVAMIDLPCSTLYRFHHGRLQDSPARPEPMSNDAVQSPLSSADHDKGGAHGNDQQVIFEAFSLLLPR